MGGSPAGGAVVAKGDAPASAPAPASPPADGMTTGCDPPPPHAAVQARTSEADDERSTVRIRIATNPTILAAVPRVIVVDPSRPDPTAIAEAAAVLARGGLVAFPTETVYGLGARGLHAADVARIFAAKGRPRAHPLILHVDGEPMARRLASSWPDSAARLAAAFWPGPLTLVVPRAPDVPDEVTGGMDTVALRAPSHAVALALIRATSEPLAAPSANAHTHVSPTSAKHVIRSLGDKVDLVLDGGACAHGIESTVVTVAETPPRILRPGALGVARLRAIVPEIARGDATLAADDVARASPGMAAKHYSPRARVAIEDAGPRAVEAALELARTGLQVGALVWSVEARDAIGRSAKERESSTELVRFVTMPDDPEAYGRALYAAFYDLDEARCDVIVVERPLDDEAWWAIVDRLTRAAAR